MKLRNKKTGELSTRLDVNEDGDVLWVLGKTPCMYETLAELNEEWEDYKPKEPLIKDEKIRKAVRAWAEANEETEIKVKGGCLVATFKGLHKQLELELNCTWTRDGVYSIAELCGEEEK